MHRANYYLELWKCADWNLPAIEITSTLNPFAKDGVGLYAVLGNALPYESMKSLAALGLLKDAIEKGINPNETTIVEATSGATGLALTHFALSHYFGFREIVLIMNEDVPSGKREAPRFAGARIEPPDRGRTAIATARARGGETGHWNPDQYANPANAALYETWAAGHILKQLFKIDVVVAPVGTGGTAIGLKKGLEDRLQNDVVMIGARCAPGVEIPGMRDLEKMAEVSLPWQAAFDEIIEVEREPAYLAAAWFQWAQSLMVGLSSGAAWIAAYTAIKKRKDAGTLDALRKNSTDGQIRVAIICHDGARPYLADRFPILHHDHQSAASAPLPWQLLKEK